MSLLSKVEQTINLYKAEQAKINDSIQLYRDLLQSLTEQSKSFSEGPECSHNAAAEINALPVEKEEIKLLEQALEKALRVRTGLGISAKDSNKNKKQGFRKEPSATSASSNDVTRSSVLPKESQTNMRSTFKSTCLDQKWHKPSGSSTLGLRASSNYNQGQTNTTNYRNKNQNHPVSSAVRSTVLSGGDLDKVAPVSSPSSIETKPHTHKDKCGTHSLLQHSGLSSEQKAKWNSLRTKQNRLWDKINALQRNPVPGRSHFMERMRAMFPKDWPCGSPYQIRLLVNRLIHQGHDLTQHCQTEELLARHNLETVTELDGKLRDVGSNWTVERLQMTSAEIKNSAASVKQEWEAWDQWRPDGGCLCPSGANDACGDATNASLPLTINYTTEAELCELENLRMRVALLQQEIYLEQALLDTLSPQLFSMLPGPERPNPSVLRDMYSLLSEGGERFPSLVLDSEPD